MDPKIRFKPPIHPKRQTNGNGADQENPRHGRPIPSVMGRKIKPADATSRADVQEPRKNMAAPASRAAAKQG
jgi:hypothetical protein